MALKDHLSCPELHSAGAIIRGHGAFEDLVSHENNEKLEIPFLDQWVKPHYNYLPRYDKEESSERLKSLCRQVTPEVVSLLLGDFNWRTRITGAFFAAVRKFGEFEGIIGVHLLKSEVCYASCGYCWALAAFNTPAGVGYLKRYLDFYLPRSDLNFDQPTVMATLTYLDDLNGTAEAEAFLPAWHQLMEVQTFLPRDWLQNRKKYFHQNMELIADLRA